MKSSNIRVYLFYIALSLLFILLAAFVQMIYVYGIYNPKLFIIPSIVGTIFGALIAKIRLLQKGQKAVLAQIKAKDQEITELNSSLEKKVEAKTREVSEQRLYTEAILNAQNSIVVITDGFSLVKANRAFFRYFDDFTSMEEFKKVHRCICDTFCEKEGFLKPDMNDSRWATYVLEHPEEDHKAFVCFNGQEYYFSVHAKKFIFGNTQKIIVTFEDITQLIKYEEELEKRISNEIESSRKKDAIIHEQARFTAIGEALRSVSHHWRQPLSALSLLIQDVREARDFNELDNAYLDVFIQKSLGLIADMSETLDSFKYIFSEEAKDKKEFSLEEAVERALSIIRSNLKAHTIDAQMLIKHPDVTVHASETEYIQVLLSILSNAIEVLENKEGVRKITLTIEKEPEGASLLRIFNNGETIPETDLEKIFDPYFSTKFEKNGTGLGLFVTKNILENRMDGSVWAQNHPGGGVEFFIRV